MSLEQISNKAISEDVLFEISRGTIPGYTPIVQFANAPNIAATMETIWPEGGEYVFPPSATIMRLSSVDTEDTLTGTGLQKIMVFGLAADYSWQYEIVDTNGLVGTETKKEYLRINELKGIQAGSLGTNVGNIYLGTGALTAGKPAIVYSLISNGVSKYHNRSSQAVFSIPKGHKLGIIGILSGVGAGKDFTVNLFHKLSTGIWNVVGGIPLYENSVNVPFRVFPFFPEGSDITLMGRENGATGVAVSANGSFILERVDKEVDFILPGSLLSSPVWV